MGMRCLFSSISSFTAPQTAFLHLPGLNDLTYTRNPWIFTHFHLRNPEFRSFSPNQNRYLRLCSNNADTSTNGFSEEHHFSPNQKGSMAENESNWGPRLTSNEMLKRLRRYGVSGILSYGLLNTGYYLTTFLLVWFYVAPAPGRMGYFAAVKRFLKVMAMVWAGSQVTKLARAGGALALAPIVDRGLSWFTVKFNFKSQGKAFGAIVGFCFGVAILLFLVITLLWA